MKLQVKVRQIVAGTAIALGLVTSVAQGAISTTLEPNGTIVINVNDTNGIAGWYLFEGDSATGVIEQRGDNSCKNDLTIELTGIKSLKGGKKQSEHGNHEHLVFYGNCIGKNVEATMDAATGLVQGNIDGLNNIVSLRVIDPDGIASIKVYRGNDNSGQDETPPKQLPQGCPTAHTIALPVQGGHNMHNHFVEYTDCQPKPGKEGWSVGAGQKGKFKDGTRVSSETAYLSGAGGGSQYHIADMNQDGLLDVVATSDSSVTVLQNLGNGILGEPETYVLRPSIPTTVELEFKRLQ